MVFSWVIYGLINIICYFLVIMYGQYEMYYAWRMIYIIPVVFLIIMILNRFLIKYDGKIITKSVMKGDKVHYEFTMSNGGLFVSGHIRTYIEVYYGQCLRQKFVVDCNLLPMEKRKHSVELIADYSGCMTIVRKKVKLYDYLRLFSISFGKKNIEDSLMVMPRISPVYMEVHSSSNMDLIETDKYHSSKKGNDRSEIFDVREYVEGDLMRDIHWKLSMKQDKYMIKEYSLPISTDLDIVVECSAIKNTMDNIAKKDKQLEVLCSVATDLIDKETAFYVNVINREYGNAERVLVETEEDLLSAVAMIMEYNKYSNKSQKNSEDSDADIAVLRSIEKKNVLLITSNPTEVMMNEFRINHQDKKIVMIYVYNSLDKLQNIPMIPDNVKLLELDYNQEGMGDIHEIRFE